MDVYFTNAELDNMDYYIRVHGDAIIKRRSRKAWKKSIKVLIKQARLANKTAGRDAVELHEKQMEADANWMKLTTIRRVFKKWRMGTHDHFSHSHNAMVDVGKALGNVDDE